MNGLTLAFIQNSAKGEEKETLTDQQRHELTDRRQFVCFLSALHGDVGRIRQFAVFSAQAFQSALGELKEIVGAKTTVPKGQVYPRFVNLGRIWRSLHYAYDDLYGLIGVSAAMLAFAYPRDGDAAVAKAEERLNVLAQAQVAGAASGQRARIDVGKLHQFSLTPVEIDHLVAAEEERVKAGEPPAKLPEEDVSVQAPQTTFNVETILSTNKLFPTISPHFEGFCPVCLVRRQGMLLPGDAVSHGYVVWTVEHLRMAFAFSSRECAELFKANPKWYVDNIYEAVRLSPELVYLLGLQDEFTEMGIFRPRKEVLTRAQAFSIFSTSALPAAPATKVDADTQTPDHFVYHALDPKYEWNEWNLRRNALQLVQLKNKHTHSSQTEQSHFRRENETQAYLPRDNSTNTGIATGQNPLKKVRYIAGLRGHPTQKVNIVNVEIEIDLTKEEKKKKK